METAQPKPPAEAVATPEAIKAVDLAIKHIFHTASVASEKELLREAMKRGYGGATKESIEAAVREFPLHWIERNGKRLVTTAEVILQEQRIIDRCWNGVGKFPALKPGWKIQDERLNEQQRNGVFHILGTHEFIIGIIGRPGVGKTTMLAEAARAIKEAGQRVRAFAPTAVASRGTLRESGFPEAETVDKLIASERLQRWCRDAVWFVDEAGLVSAKQADRFLALAEKLNSRVVLVGDPQQHRSVERGDAFRLLKLLGGMETVIIDEIQRQRGLYKEAVQHIFDEKYDRAIDTFERMGAISEIPDFDARYNALAAHYVSLVEKGKSVRLVAPTRIECEIATEKIREEMKARKLLKEGREWPVLRNLHFSPGDKDDWRCYEAGQIVRMTGPVEGFEMGEELEVVEAHERELIVRGEGRLKTLPYSSADKFNVFRRDVMEICPGDEIRVTLNSQTAEGHLISNGDYFEVKGFTRKGEILLTNGWKLEKSLAHLDYGFGSTSYSAQSINVDVVLLAQSALISREATDANQFVTAATRGKEDIHIYVDNLDALRDLVSRVRTRELALEVISEQAKPEAPEMAVGFDERDVEIGDGPDESIEREIEVEAEDSVEPGTEKEQEAEWEELEMEM